MQADAALTTIGQAQYGGQNYNMIWDNDSPFGSLIWLDYTKSATNWQNQVNWAAGLNSGGVLTYNIAPTYNVTWGGNWRLPSTVDGLFVYGNDGATTGGYNITSSEMGHLFHTELGNKGYLSTTGVYQPDYGLKNKGSFTNMQPYVYWSGTQYAANTNLEWYFDSGYGIQATNSKSSNFYALAVRPGLAVAVVPEPVSMVLFGVGGVVLVARRMVLRRRG